MVFKDPSSHNNFWHFAEQSEATEAGRGGEKNQVKISELELNWVFRKFVIHCKLKKKYKIYFFDFKEQKRQKEKKIFSLCAH